MRKTECEREKLEKDTVRKTWLNSIYVSTWCVMASGKAAIVSVIEM